MKYSYDQNFSPPAPVLTVEIFVPDNMQQRQTLAAKLDTAADISAIPAKLITDLGIEPESEIVVSGYNSPLTVVRTYTIGMELSDVRIRRIEVVPIEDDYVLLGRDALNNFYISLDGPELSFEISASHDSGTSQSSS